MSQNTNISVNEIFDLLRNGQQHDGVELLYKYHYNKMYGVAFSIVKKEDISQDIVSEYDAWFNVKDNYLIFGVAVKNPEKVEQYYNEFIHYMGVNHNANIEKVEKTERWIMPRIMPGCEIDYGKGRILFAGETAGFLNPMGEGISCGMESGYELAKAIQTVDIGNDYNEKDLLATYKTNTAEIHNYMIRQWRFVARMSATFDNMK